MRRFTATLLVCASLNSFPLIFGVVVPLPSRTVNASHTLAFQAGRACFVLSKAGGVEPVAEDTVTARPDTFPLLSAFVTRPLADTSAPAVTPLSCYHT